MSDAELLTLARGWQPYTQVELLDWVRRQEWAGVVYGSAQEAVDEWWRQSGAYVQPERVPATAGYGPGRGRGRHSR